MALIDLVSTEDLDEEQRATVEAIVDKGPYAHDSPYRRARMHNLELLDAMTEFRTRLLESGPVDDVLYEYVMVATAQTNDCDYCAASHRKKLKEAADLTLSELLAISKGDYTGVSERDRTVMQFAEQVAGDPHGVTEDHIAALRRVGFDEGGIIQLLVCIGQCTVSNTVVSALGITPADRADDLSGY